MEKKGTALIIAAHFSDELIGVGGTIPLLKKKNYRVYVVILCDKTNINYGQEEIMKLKKQSEKVAEYMGIEKYFYFDYPFLGLNVFPRIEIVKNVVKCIEQVSPCMVYVHHGGDINADHKAAFDATIAATRSFGNNIVSKVFSYEVPSTTEWALPFMEFSFLPNIFETITDTIHMKNEAFHLYESEQREYPHQRSIKSLEINAKLWGIKIGADYAEAFENVRMLGAIS